MVAEACWSTRVALLAGEPVARAQSVSIEPRLQLPLGLQLKARVQMLKEQTPGWGLGWSLPEGLFLHEGSSGTLAWADPKTGVIGILFLQYRDQNEADVRLRKGFRQAVRDAFAEWKRASGIDERAPYFPPPESRTSRSRSPCST